MVMPLLWMDRIDWFPPVNRALLLVRMQPTGSTNRGTKVEPSGRAHKRLVSTQHLSLTSPYVSSEVLLVEDVEMKLCR